MSSWWEKNFICNNAHNFFILSFVFFKLLIVSVAFFLGHLVLQIKVQSCFFPCIIFLWFWWALTVWKSWFAQCNLWVEHRKLAFIYFGHLFACSLHRLECAKPLKKNLIFDSTVFKSFMIRWNICNSFICGQFLLYAVLPCVLFAMMFLSVLRIMTVLRCSLDLVLCYISGNFVVIHKIETLCITES